jgi:hypothetical protein
LIAVVILDPHDNGCIWRKHERTNGEGVRRDGRDDEGFKRGMHDWAAGGK